MKQKKTKFFSIMVSLVVTLAMLVMTIQPVIAAPAPGKVDLVLLPATQTVDSGGTIDVTIQAQCGTQTTDGIETHLNFDPLLLEVQSITAGNVLTLPLQNVYNNSAGTVDFSAGSITPVTGTFTVATVTFTAKSVLITTNTAVSFNTSGARITMVTFSGSSITGILTGATYTIVGTVTPPTVQTGAADNITSSSVTLNGLLSSKGTAATVNVYFEYGYTTSYGKTTAAQPMTNTGAFNADITGLLPGITWHYRTVAVGDVTVHGDDMTFTTTPIAVGLAKAAFISDRDGNDEVYAVTADGMYQSRLTNNTAQEAWPRYWFDNYNFSKITFTSWRDGNPEVYWMHPDGTVPTRLTNNAAFDGMSDFSWNGTRIAFVSDRDGNYEIYVMNADGTGQTRLTNNVASDIMPAFSPDGTKIAFASNRDGNYEVYVMNADGTGQTRLTNNGASDTYPSWFSDGTKISFSTMRDGNSEIYTINAADGTGAVNLTNNPVADDQPYWCPTGNAIIFTSWRDAVSTPQVWFVGAVQAYQGMIAAFTNNTQGNNWSRANWTVPSIQTYSINASVPGGHGTVDPASQTVNAGANATITIYPASGYHIASITDNGTAATIANPYIISNVSADHTVVVTCSYTYKITATAGTGGTISPSGIVTVNPGANKSFAIATNTGYHVADVLVDGLSVGAVSSYTFTNVTADHSIAATFAVNDSTPPIIQSISPANNATGVLIDSVVAVTFSEAMNHSATEGAFSLKQGTTAVIGTLSWNTASTILTFTPTSNLAYNKLYTVGISTAAIDTAGNHVATAFASTFTTQNTPQTYSINASVSGGHGAVAPASQTVNAGVNARIDITPDSGYHIASITDNGTTATIDNPYIISNVIANHIVVVTFSNTTTYTITASAGVNGLVTPLGVVEVNPGANQSFTITANIGYHVADVKVDGVSVGAVSSYTFTNVMANHTIVATFAINDSSGEILKSITAGADDGYSTSGAGDYNSDVEWYEAGSPIAGSSNNAWFRFIAITIPTGAIIDEAYLEMIQSEWEIGTSLKIYAEDAANPSAPTSAGDHSNRTRTTSGVTWTNGHSDPWWQNSPNFASVIQELINSYSYNNGVIQILLDNNGSTNGAGAAGYTFENTGFAPRLYIRYHMPSPPPAGGGGGGGVVGGGGTSPGYTDLSAYVGSDGIFINDATAHSIDGMVVLVISKGTKFLTISGYPGTGVTIAVSEDKPIPPAGSDIVGLYYNLAPNGAIFDPGITLTFSYNGLDLGTFNEKNLALAYWDNQTQKWVKLNDCQVDTTKKTVTARTNHFTIFAIIGYFPSPAAFTTSNLVITPTSVEAGKDVTVTISVTNTGDLGGKYTVSLQVSGGTGAIKDVTLNGGETQQVSFTVNRVQVGTYNVLIGSLSSKFTCLKPAAYRLSNLAVTPIGTETGKDVTISFDVENTGEVSGNYLANLQISGVTEATKEITLVAGEKQLVTFTVNRTQPGTYSVAVGSLSSSVTYLKPATFVASELVINPTTVNKGKTITVNFNVANTGDVGGTYTVNLKINDIIVSTKDITLASRESQPITFDVVPNETGTYAVNAGGLTGSFVVKQFSQAWLFVGIGGVLVVVILLTIIFLTGRRKTAVS
jgi:Tol biopolymer transport system component